MPSRYEKMPKYKATQSTVWQKQLLDSESVCLLCHFWSIFHIYTYMNILKTYMYTHILFFDNLIDVYNIVWTPISYYYPVLCLLYSSVFSFSQLFYFLLAYLVCASNYRCCMPMITQATWYPEASISQCPSPSSSSYDLSAYIIFSMMNILWCSLSVRGAEEDKLFRAEHPTVTFLRSLC